MGDEARVQLRQPGKRAPATDFNRAVRNTYKVLLTRGMRGTVLMSTDPEAQDFLQSLISLGSSAARPQPVSVQA